MLSQLVTDASLLPGYELLKYSPSNEVLRACLNTSDGSWPVICKRSRAVGVIAYLAGLMRGSRARRNAARALRLMELGIPTAKPLFVLERGLHESWLVTTQIDDPIDLDQLLLGQPGSLPAARGRGLKWTLIRRIVELLLRMQRAGLSHRDFKAPNLLISGWRDNPQDLCIWLVDLDGLCGLGRMMSSRRLEPLARLAASLRHHSTVTRTDRLRALLCYLDKSDSGRQAWKAAFRRVARLAERHHRQPRADSRDRIASYSGER